MDPTSHVKSWVKPGVSNPSTVKGRRWRQSHLDIQIWWQSPSQRNAGESSRAGHPTISSGFLVCVSTRTPARATHTYAQQIFKRSLMCNTKDSMPMASKMAQRVKVLSKHWPLTSAQACTTEHVFSYTK